MYISPELTADLAAADDFLLSWEFFFGFVTIVFCLLYSVQFERCALAAC